MAIYQIQIEGKVQGVGFRPFVYRLATSMQLLGYVLNNQLGVKIGLSCNQNQLQKFLIELQKNKPIHSFISRISINGKILSPVEINTEDYCFEPSLVDTNSIFNKFEIRASEANFGALTWEQSSIGTTDRSKGNEFSDVSRISGHDMALTDISTCIDCYNEIMSEENRRYQYLFTNCTQCGPRHTIIENAPYDRFQTTMKSFMMCKECEKEYQDPSNRRFHAEPNACSQCGPQIRLEDLTSIQSEGIHALEKCVELLKLGYIVAVKGIGGYHLVADPYNEEVLQKLRHRKNRQTKPFALMFPNEELINKYCEVSEVEREWLKSPAAPIVLLRRKMSGAVAELNLAPSVAPNSLYLGVMLPYSPLHHWLMKLHPTPLVMTSANVTEEPIVYKEPEVFHRLQGIADYFITHNRSIVSPMEDSVVQIVNEKVMVLRLARGLAPLRFELDNKFSMDHLVTKDESLINAELSLKSASLFATGGHVKSAFALANKKSVILSQYLGDLDTDLAQEHYQNERNRYLKYFQHIPTHIVYDFHPSYYSTVWAKEFCKAHSLKKSSILHHKAHIFSAFIENEIEGSFLGVSWDGMGFGSDRNLWGGEFFLNSDKTWNLHKMNSNPLIRRGHIRPFTLLGGEVSIREPWRVALALLFDLDLDHEKSMARNWFIRTFGEEREKEFFLLRQQWVQKINTFETTSVGRFFEGVSALMHLQLKNSYEAEAAIALESIAQLSVKGYKKTENCDQSFRELIENSHWSQNHQGELWVWDWRPLVHYLFNRFLFRNSKVELSTILHQKEEIDRTKNEWGIILDSQLVHLSFVQSIFDLAQVFHQDQIILGGGVFQNRYLLQLILEKAEFISISNSKKTKFKIVLPSLVPLNDGGLAMGQIISQFYLLFFEQ